MSGPELSMTVELSERIAAEVRERCAAFLRDEVSPGVAERDRAAQTFSPAVLRRAGELGLFGWALPRAAGGGGASPLVWGRVLEEIGYLCEDLSFQGMLFTAAYVANAIDATGRADYRERYVRPMARGERRGAFAFSEGSDALSFKTRAHRQPDGSYVVNGQKLPLSGALGADVFLAYARDEHDDVVGLLVEPTDPGVRASPIETNGMRTYDFCRLSLEAVRVPADRVMVPGDGVSHAQEVLNSTRGLIVGGLIGRMRALLEMAIASISRKVRFNRALAERTAVQATLGRMVMLIESSRAAFYRALERMVQGRADRHWDPLISAAKCHVAEQAQELVQLATRLMGGEGFMDERLARSQRDFAAFLTVNGTSDVLQIDLGVHALQDFAARRARRAGR